MGRLKAVFFDAAGTLFEPREPVGNSYARIAREYGVETSAAEVNSAFRRVFHDAGALAFGPGRQATELRRLERDWWHDLVAKTFHGLGNFRDFDGYFDSLFAFFANPENWVADAAASATLKTLRQEGFILGVISNFDYRIYHILDGLNLTQWFDSITISSEAGFAKPSATLFEVALDRHRLSAEQALHVGDSEHLDLAGARAAGLNALLIDANLAGQTFVLDSRPEHQASTAESASTTISGRIGTLAAVVEVVRLLFEPFGYNAPE